MRFVHLILIGLLLYLGMFSIVFGISEDSVIINGESLLYPIALTFILALFLIKADSINLPLIVVLTFYAFIMYLLAALKLFLLSLNNDTWDTGNYSWATSAQVNHWLRYSILCITMVGSGILFGTKVGSNKKDKCIIENLNQEDIKISPKALLVVYIIFMVITIDNLRRFGYGSISGQEMDAINTLYGVINPEPILHIALIIIVFQWNKLSRSNKNILLFIILSLAVFRVVGGSRSALYALLMPTIYFLSLFKKNFLVNKRAIFMVVVLIVLSLLLYPIGKGFKEMFHYMSVPNESITFANVRETISVLDIMSDFFDRQKQFSLEIIDRLSDMGAQLRITNDMQVVPVEDHINLINIIKRIINDMVPGEVFTDVVRTQSVYHVVYFGIVPDYGGEIYSLFAVYYVLFGYGGALIALFFTSTIIGYYWRKLLISHIPIRPIIIGFCLLSFDWLLQNELMEGWFVNRVYRPFFSLIFTLFLLTFLSNLLNIFRLIHKMIIRNNER